jgi:repressor LexA
MTNENTKKYLTANDLLTKRQTEVLDVIRSHIDQHGAPPTRAEIAKKLGFKSVNAAEDHLKALARKGAIALFPGTSRGIQLIGEHSAGLPILTRKNTQVTLVHAENIETRCKIDPELFEPTATFLLRIEKAFVQDGISEGDLVAIHQCSQAENGQLILARVNNELLLRVYYRRNDCIELTSNGAKNSPLKFALGNEHAIQIEGIAVGLIRKNLIPQVSS